MKRSEEMMGINKQPMNNNFEEVIKELKKEYLDRLPQKVVRIDELFAKLKSAPCDFESLQQLIHLIHKIHGNAGSYDLDRLSLFAAEWENRLNPWVEQQDSLTSDQLRQLHNFVHSLREMAQDILQES